MESPSVCMNEVIVPRREGRRAAQQLGRPRGADFLLWPTCLEVRRASDRLLWQLCRGLLFCKG
jgi:hypothetical protein